LFSLNHKSSQGNIPCAVKNMSSMPCVDPFVLPVFSKVRFSCIILQIFQFHLGLAGISMLNFFVQEIQQFYLHIPLMKP